MKWPRLAPQRTVVVYYACFAFGWALLAASLVTAAPDLGPGVLRPGRADGNPVGLLLALAGHAAMIACLAWQAQRWFFAHGPVAVALSGLPLLVLVAELWFVAAFFYLIAVLHVWLACRHESIGKLQTTHTRSTGNGHA